MKKKILEMKKNFQKKADDFLFENKNFLKNINDIFEDLYKNKN